MKALRSTLAVIGTVVWVPYAIFKYGLQDPFPVWWVLIIHIPCMFGALALRIWAWKEKRVGRESREVSREL